MRMKAAAGSGLNTGFFTYIGPVHKQPHDEIDFEVLGKNPSKVQINQYVDGKSVGERSSSMFPAAPTRASTTMPSSGRRIASAGI